MHESHTKALSKYIILFDKIRNIYRFKNRHFNQVLTYFEYFEINYHYSFILLRYSLIPLKVPVGVYI